MNKLKSIVYFFSLFTFFSTLAQDAENQYLINLLKQKKEEIHNEERELLKLKIKEVNEQLYKETISQETADSLKLLYAKETAKSIEEKQLNAETDIFQKKIDTISKHLYSVEKLKSDLNFNDIVYGVSGYLSLPNVVTLYGKPDLSMLFKNQPFLHHNVSLGIRFDIN